MANKIVLAYSGGLDTSCSIKWLQEKYNYDVIAVTMDVGEGKDLEAIRQKALLVGASKCYILPLQKKFAEDMLIPAIYANTLYEGSYPLISALSRPLIAKALVDIAIKEKAHAVAHGCTGKGNDQVRFDIAIQSLAPHLQIIAPAREAPMSREEAILFAKKNNIPLPINLANPYSIDQNLWGRSCECGVLEDPWVEPPEDAYALTKAIKHTSDEALEVMLTFDRGVPIAINGKSQELHHLITTMNEIAGSAGVGRIDHVENRLVGIKSREVYEAPAAVSIIKAHQALEALVLPREVSHFKQLIEQKFANSIYEGLWFSPLRHALYAFLKSTQKNVTGTVRLKFHKGHVIVTGRRSPHSLYIKNLATYAADDQFDHQAANGFIKIWGLSTTTYARVNQSNDE